MKFAKPLQRVKLIRRYKRFLADVEWPDGSVMTVHTANTGAMLGCSTPGNFIWIRDSGNDKRKYRYSWEISETEYGGFVGVNTILANRLVVEGIDNGKVAELSAYQGLRQEVPCGERSRIDILLHNHRDHLPDCYVEVKNVTAQVGNLAIFPDAVTERGARHLHELTQVIKAGKRAVMFYCVQREDVDGFRSASEIDPGYAETLLRARKHGVEILAYRVSISPRAIMLTEPIAIHF